MKKNLSDILKNASPAQLDGMFDAVEDKKANKRKIKKAVLSDNAQNEVGYTDSKRGGAVLVPVIAVLLVASVALIFLPTLVKRDTPDPVSGLTEDITRTDGGTVSEPPETDKTAVTGPATVDETEENSNIVSETVASPVIGPGEKMTFDPFTTTGAFAHREDYERIIWSDNDGDIFAATLNDSVTVKWNGLTVTDRFRDILEDSPDDALFAVTVKTTTPDLTFRDYVYSYQSDYIQAYEENELNMMKWLYLQDILPIAKQNNTARMENRIKQSSELYGEDFLCKYYHDGVFETELIKEDLKKYEKLTNDLSENGLETPYNAFMLQIRSDIRYAAYTVGQKNNYNFITNSPSATYFYTVLTKAELARICEEAEKQNVLSGFDFEHSCFTMIKAAGTDFGLALDNARSSLNGSAASDFSEIPVINYDLPYGPYFK